MLFLVMPDCVASQAKAKGIKISETAGFDFEEFYSQVLTDDRSRLVQSGSTLLIYEAVFPNQMVKSPLIDDCVLVNPPDDWLRYFIILDAPKRTITMAKGLSAAKSLYYFIDQNSQKVCCSNRISLLRKCGVPLRENKDILPEFFVSRFVAPPNTMYENIFKVAAGQKINIIFKEDSIEVDTCSIYVPQKARDQFVHRGHFSTRLLEFITEDLTKIYDLDKNASLLLSGGIDSSVLAKIGIMLGKIKETYSTSYPFVDSEDDTERRYALTAAKSFGISHKHFEATTQEFLKALIYCIAINEAPIQWPQSVMLYLLLNRGLPKDSKIIISGYGADGIVGGSLFSLRRRIPLMEALSSLRLSKMFVRLFELFKKDASILSKSIEKQFDNPENIIWHSTNYGDENWVCKTFGVDKKQIIKGRLKAIHDCKDHSIFDIICLLDHLEGTETQSIWNRLAESAGKVFYFPFQTRKFVEACFSIPWTVKLREPKHVIRCVARELNIPDLIITRKKSGFGLAPYVDLWATPRGVFAPLVRFCREYFSDAEISELQTGEQKKAATLWSMIMYSIWRKIMIENVPVSDLVRLLTDEI